MPRLIEAVGFGTQNFGARFRGSQSIFIKQTKADEEIQKYD